MAHLTDTYSIQQQKQNTFTFISTGVNGLILKAIVFQLTNITLSIYNLAFGDLTENGLDDFAVTNNGDTWKILSTVAAAVDMFFQINGPVRVFAKGSTPARTRLYRMGITKHYAIISKKYTILGLGNDSWEPFAVGVVYEGYLMFLK